MFTKFEMFLVGLESFGALPAPKPWLVYYIPTFVEELFFSPPCFSSTLVFSKLMEPVFAISLMADL